MKKVDPAVIRETLYVAAFSFLFSLVMQGVFLVSGKWDITAVFGNLLGYAACVGNFFFMGLGVQRALGKEEKEAKNVLRLSQNARFIALFFVALAAYLAPHLNVVATVVPFLFARLAVLFRPLFFKKGQ